MRCYIYRGRRKPDTYLYLAVPEDFSAVPEELMRAFGKMERVMDLVLTPDRQLAQEDARQVLRNLLQRGFHIQLPPAGDLLSLADREDSTLTLH